MISEFFRIAIRSLTRRRLRSWLTMIGIFIGIAAVISLISLGQGMQHAVLDIFEDIGSDKLFIQPKTTFGVIGDNTGRNPLTEDDVNFLRSINGVDSLTYQTMASVKVNYQDNTRYFMAAGVPNNNQDELELMMDIFATEMGDGRWIGPGDKTVANIGFHHNTKEYYGGKNLEINSKFYINDQKFTTAGILEPIGSSADDQMIIVPIDTLRDITDIGNRVDFIILKINEGKDPLEVAENIEYSLARYRNVDVGKEDFTVLTPEELLASFDTIISIIQAVLIGIALISLFVGGVGIMNTMYTSVLERNKEIGIMKAIGAKNSDIFTIFFIESGILGLFGGLLGIIIGIGLAKAVEIISEQALGKTFLVAHFSWELFVGTLAFAFIVGALAGTLPAIQASKQKPADILRDE